ncbi:MAG: ABC transporter permease subunit, partial [Nocardioides sp.]
MAIHLSAVPGDESAATSNEMFTYRPPRHVGRLIAGGLLILVIAYLAVAFFSTPLIHFSVIPDYIFSARVRDGLRVTFVILIASLLIGLFVGTILAFMRMSANPVAKMFGGFYVWFFLATPGIVQLLFWYNLAIVFPNLGVGIPRV